jgi:hypothetical protein
MNTPHPHAGKGDRLVCDCWSGDEHIPSCVLGQAETVALRGLGEAASDTHPLVAALGALTYAGLLPPADPDETTEKILMQLLDELYQAGMLTPPDPSDSVTNVAEQLAELIADAPAWTRGDDRVRAVECRLLKPILSRLETLAVGGR